MTPSQNSSDHDRLTAIIEKPGWTPNEDCGHIGVAVTGGAVTLSGLVANYPENQAATGAALQVRGVVAVADEIVVRPSVAISPVTAQANIVSALVRNARVDAKNVEVSVDGSEIRLTGKVTSWAERHQAEYAGWSTLGVTHVDNQLQIAGSR